MFIFIKKREMVIFLIFILFSILKISPLQGALPSSSPAYSPVIKLSPPSKVVFTGEQSVHFKWQPSPGALLYEIVLYAKSPNSCCFRMLGKGYFPASRNYAILRRGAVKNGYTYAWNVRAYYFSPLRGFIAGKYGKWFYFYVKRNYITPPKPKPKPKPQPKPQPNSSSNTQTENNNSNVPLKYSQIMAKSEQQIVNEVLNKYGIKFLEYDTNWTKEQMAWSYEDWEHMYLGFVKHTKGVYRQTLYRSPYVLGYVRIPIPKIYMLNSATRSKQQFQNTLAHEMTHCFQCDGRDIFTEWAQTFHGIQNPYGYSARNRVSGAPTSYGNTNVYEDMAESVRCYIFRPQYLKTNYPKRYQFIKEKIMNGKEYTGREMF